MINIEEHLGLVRKIAYKYRNSIGYDDAYQLGSIGLYKAIQSFDDSKGYKLSTIATKWIEGEIKHYMRTNGTIVKLDTFGQRYQYVIKSMLNQDKSIEEISKVLKVKEDKVEQVRIALEDYHSLDFEVIGKVKQSSSDFISSDDRLIEDVIEEKLLLEQALSELNERERECVLLRFVEDRTQDEIASLLGINQANVSRCIRRGITKMRDSLAI